MRIIVAEKAKKAEKIKKMEKVIVRIIIGAPGDDYIKQPLE